MFVIVCLKAKHEGKRYVNRSHYPCNVEFLEYASKFDSVEQCIDYAKTFRGNLDTGDGWIMCAVEKLVAKPVCNLIGVGNWLDKI